ncbi:phage baseplate plug family protein [Burkholderia gladioli]|uniref:phage baseplate plug family protein n=1 Tax=Burkholderia gladioli TaxID=28095 RepID=UPI003F7A7F7C
MTTLEIPLSSDGQTFSITLGGVDYTLTVQWRNAIGLWLLDIADASGNALVSGLPLVTGTNLLGQYGYLGFGGGLWVQGGDDPDDLPEYADLGESSHLYWVTS